MGFTKPTIIHTLKWPEGDPLHGLEVRAASVTVEKYDEIMDLIFSERETRAEASAANEKYFSEFVKCLRSWNMTEPDTDEPVPITRDGLKTVDQSVVSRIVAAWQQALVTVPTPPPMPSSNGSSRSDSAEHTLDLASLSKSLGS